MCKLLLVLGLMVAVLVVESTSQFRIIRPTYRPPPRPRRPIIRIARAAGDEPQWLNKGDDVIRAPATGEHPILPSIIDDVKMDPNTRYARSLSSGRVGLYSPTKRPPPTKPRQPILRIARAAGDEPQWLNKGDDVIRAPATGEHPILPSIIDDVKMDPNTRHARSLSTPGRGRVGSNDGRRNGGTRGHDTGATHPGYNRRNARSLGLPDFATTPPFNPKPWPGFPKPNRPRFPIYV